jgi:hypothetical protein
MIHLKSVASMSLHVRKVRGIISKQDDSQWIGKTPLTDELVDARGAVLGIVGPAGRDRRLHH